MLPYSSKSTSPGFATENTANQMYQQNNRQYQQQPTYAQPRYRQWQVTNATPEMRQPASSGLHNPLRKTRAEVRRQAVAEKSRQPDCIVTYSIPIRFIKRSIDEHIIKSLSSPSTSLSSEFIRNLRPPSEVSSQIDAAYYSQGQSVQLWHDPEHQPELLQY